MKYIVDPTWGLQAMRRRLQFPLDAYVREIPTTFGRTMFLLLARDPSCVRLVFEDAGQTLSENNLLGSNGLCTHFVGEIKGNKAEIHPHHDGLVGIFSHDTGFRRGAQSIRRTAYHEAVHMARFIAQQQTGAKYKDPVFTLELEEATADWTGRLAQEFADSLHMMPGV